jgi:RNA polymerase sigma-70 factor (ECF subfamily)
VTARNQEVLWVLLAQTGDREALECLLRSVEGSLYSYISNLVRRRDLAEDILQEVFFRIYRKLPWLRQAELFRPWAYRIASRESFKCLRRERMRSERMRGEDELAALPAPEYSRSSRQEVIESLQDLLEAVSPASRAVMILHYLHEMSLQEVADVLEVNLGTVKSRLAYGLTRLRGQCRSHRS